MKQKFLLLLLSTLVVTGVTAQKNKKITAFAITATQKGGTEWSEVRLVDVTTGEEVETIYATSEKPAIFNARTGKAIELKTAPAAVPAVQEYRVTRNVDGNQVTVIRRATTCATKISSDQPFATKSAAMAYDKKHDRLYYTPMGIDQLRYIDMKSKTPKVYYFENEPFGVLGSNRSTSKQITRMVIASDGNGYALTNDANHLIRFTTGKKPEITDLGTVNDAPGNEVSVHHSAGYGGDLIADEKKNLYLITANRNVYKISLESQVADYVGSITGLPRGFTTNGAVVEDGSTVIVTSAHSTIGYYKFDLNTLQAEKMSSASTVFNASDLANGNLVDVKKPKKERKEPEPEVVDLKPVDQTKDVAVERTKKPEQILGVGSIAIYPNPVVANGVVKVAFTDQPAGRYNMQLLDISGKLISTTNVTISNKYQVEDFRLPTLITKGNYLLKVTSETDQSSVVNKLIVQ
jgi:hypothetical protein